MRLRHSSVGEEVSNACRLQVASASKFDFSGSISLEMYIEVHNESRWLQADRIGPGIEGNMEKACCLETLLGSCW